METEMGNGIFPPIKRIGGIVAHSTKQSAKRLSGQLKAAENTCMGFVILADGRGTGAGLARDASPAGIF
ncbi:hypothetical protein C4556_03555 [Candidatus Parcubacteria bacterium]|nr:MAG: hypothetical protein C4556_03555 [Candidatus Parcubacteria bacterium]